MPVHGDNPRENAVNEVLTSVAKEEIAIANLIDAEAEKIKKIVDSHHLSRPDDFEKIIALQKSVAEILERLIQKQQILVKKLELIKDFDTDKKGEKFKGKSNIVSSGECSD
ncbi:hypothetical protein Calow_1953 [Caldicellulosiruptor owensensis OL]|uniref:Uncharacterized protein n=1 Tax=Caldicellulosiruptor owensensis (strain ATCC 700167 / DSM 13100 / OL) TaxID=632518 RepID=E4Q5S0_CALOW|nr:hypothetical protein [Caldicellulosiruptor owensensis]ADQ05479.1 hypothetical protein Calow_1953 [Caldicellulosiruptor owensensis OL]